MHPSISTLLNHYSSIFLDKSRIFVNVPKKIKGPVLTMETNIEIQFIADSISGTSYSFIGLHFSNCDFRCWIVQLLKAKQNTSSCLYTIFGPVWWGDFLEISCCNPWEVKPTQLLASHLKIS